jgi:1,4-dihydroxy-6-naphthoate synthase
MLIRVGHTPDPDDIFMFWALLRGRIDTGDHELELVLKDIQTLNEWAIERRLEVTSVSTHTYPRVHGDYVLLPHGASMGFGYGPVVVARQPDVELTEVEIAVPGRMTTAFLALRLFLETEFRYRELPFDRILEEVASGDADAGLVIHEDQQRYEDLGLVRVVDLGDWWLRETGLPLPLSVNVVRRDLGDRVVNDLVRILGESIEEGLAHREEAARYAMQFGRGLKFDLGDRFVGMYVNDLARDYGHDGQLAVHELLKRGEAAGVFDAPVRVDFAGQ